MQCLNLFDTACRIAEACIYLLTFSTCILTERISTSENKITIHTCSSIFAFSLVSLVICFRQMSAPVRVALPEELQSPLYVGKLGRPVS